MLAEQGEPVPAFNGLTLSQADKSLTSYVKCNAERIHCVKGIPPRNIPKQSWGGNKERKAFGKDRRGLSLGRSS